MSWSFQLANGDLALGTNGLNVVTGAAKLTQDLRCALLEPMGTDPLHPTFGSVLDGGTDPTTGNPVPSMIGIPNDQGSSTLISAEINRVCAAYQQQQIARNAIDVATYGKSTLTADEALLRLEGVNVQRVEDQALVTVSIQTGAGSLPLNVPFTT